MVAAIWPALRAKPLGSQPYRWGTYVAITVVWPTFWLIVSSVDEVTAGRPRGALVLSLVAGVYATASVGLLQRRKFGVVALCMACMANLMLDSFFRFGTEPAVSPGSPRSAGFFDRRVYPFISTNTGGCLVFVHVRIFLETMEPDGRHQKPRKSLELISRLNRQA